MSEHTSQVVGLIGFILAGFVFVAVGVRSGDVLTVAGSVLWIVSCLVWMAPLRLTTLRSGANGAGARCGGLPETGNVVVEVMTMYPTPDLPTVLVEHRSRIDAAHRRRLARSAAGRRRPGRSRRAPLARRRGPHQPTFAPTPPLATEG